MAGRPAFPRAETVEDIRTLRRRGLTWAEVADALDMSRSTLNRIRQEAGLT